MQLRKFSFYKLLGLLIGLSGQTVLAYKPASLIDGSSPKYENKSIDLGWSVDGNWMKTMRDFYGSEAAVWESFAPSAMVDANGDLYAITLHDFNTSNGPRFAISKYGNNSTTNIPSIKKSVFTFSPWTKIPGVTPNCVSVPKFDFNEKNVDNEKNMFKNYIYNAFMPCLAQEVNGYSKHLYGFVYIPTTRLMNATVTNECSGAENGATEGILFFKLKKDGLSNLTTKYIPHTDKADSGIQNRRVFQYNYLRPRATEKRYDNQKLQPQYGNFMACYNDNENKIYLWHIADNNEGKGWNEAYRSTFSESGDFKNLIEAAPSYWNRFLIPKIVKCGNYMYYMTPVDGVAANLYKQSISNEGDQSKVGDMAAFQYLEYATYTKDPEDPDETIVTVGTPNAWTWSNFPFDFLVLDTDNNKKIWCVLGFQGINDCHKNPPKSRFDYLKAFYLTKDQGWYGEESRDTGINADGIANTYCNFNCENAALVLWVSNFEGNTITHYREHTTNIIYTTNIKSSGATPVTNLSADNSGRLYLNTQKMCTYKNYIIYAYCYPGKDNGKGNHLYIGYVPYIITSDARLRLLTKTEFKDASDNSFITDCSRIISLDCKNGHVWLTYMDSNNTAYKYFYIKASDLVGE